MGQLVAERLRALELVDVVSDPHAAGGEVGDAVGAPAVTPLDGVAGVGDLGGQARPQLGAVIAREQPGRTSGSGGPSVWDSSKT